MNKKELTNINNVLTQELKSYCLLELNNIKERIKAYANIYNALGLMNEYNDIINLTMIENSNLNFISKETLKDYIEIIKSYKKEITSNCLDGDFLNFGNYLSEIIWSIEKISLEDKELIEKQLNNLQFKG